MCKVVFSAVRMHRNCKLQFWHLLVVLAMAGSPGDARHHYHRQMAESNTSCPVDYSYLRKFPASLDLCKPSRPTNDCCAALLNTFGVGLAENLKDTGVFEFPDNATASACLSSFQTALRENGVEKDFVRTCFPNPFPDPAMFIQHPGCAGIMNITDWNRVIGPHPLDKSCRGNLASPSDCQFCTNDVTQAVVQLQTLSNSTLDQQCVYVACLYAAGVVNSLGPQEPSTASCLLGTSEAPKGSRGSKRKVGTYIGIGVAISLAAVLVLAMVVYVLHRARKRDALTEASHGQQIRMPNTGMIQFTYGELKSGTQNFSQKNFIGEGGFGKVYRGTLATYGNLDVAVKVMKNSSPEGDAEFLNEVEVINTVRHRNLVDVRGGCIYVDGAGNRQRMLVYDYMPNGSLQDYLFSGTKPLLSWPERRKIAVGTAVGINYLHNEVQPAIIHRDIKPSNILLDEDFNARVADFGLAKLTPEGMTCLTTRVAGTPVYMAVEYALYGQCSEKIDVYSFGIVLLELMSGRKALDTMQQNPMHYHIVDWAWSLVKAGQLQTIIDEKIRGTGPVSVMERFVLVGILCAHLLVAFRPPIAQALKMLEGDEEIPEIPDRPAPYIWANTNTGDLGSPVSSSLPFACVMDSSGGRMSTVQDAELLR